MYLASNWSLQADGDSAIVNLGHTKGLLFVEEAGSAIALWRDRWFYLRDGNASLMRLREWIYLRDGDMWMLRLPWRWHLLSERGKLRLGRSKA